MKSWAPWDSNNPNLVDWWDDDGDPEPVPAGDPNEPMLTIPEVVALGAGRVTAHLVRKAIAAHLFPTAKRRRGRGRSWLVPKSEAEAWLERMCIES